MILFTVITSVIFMFMLVRNINSSIEMNEYKKGKRGEVLYVMEDSRTSIKILRIVCVLLIISVVVLFILDVTKFETMRDIDALLPASLVIGLLIFVVAPFSTSRWVMTQDGIYVYNSNLFVPWSQMITSGVSTRGKNTYITVQIKKEKSEFLKQAFQLLMVKPEDADRLSETIRAFIHALDKMKMLKRRKDEKADAVKKKKTWY